ncbi:MAG: transcriptional repressor [Bacteriovoracaceae bacterium]|nr:transcriptional repressor [Bacteriovoracaceae bacterium]
MNASCNLIKHLKENNFSCTETRKLLFHVIDEHIQHHFDADELFQLIVADDLPISRASMYRTLSIFETIGIIRKVQFTDRHAHYEYICHRNLHGHTICTKCKQVVSFHNQTIDKLIKELAEEQGLSYFSHTLEIIGMCRKCLSER